MFALTPKERKTLLFIGILVLAGSLIRFFNIAEKIPKFAGVTEPAVININRASSEDLEKLPGIGKEISRRIIEYRTKFGEFKAIDDLKKVKGIGEKKSELIKPYITF